VESHFHILPFPSPKQGQWQIDHIKSRYQTHPHFPLPACRHPCAGKHLGTSCGHCSEKVHDVVTGLHIFQKPTEKSNSKKNLLSSSAEIHPGFGATFLKTWLLVRFKGERETQHALATAQQEKLKPSSHRLA